MVSMDTNCGSCFAVDISSVCLLTLQRHPTNGSATYERERDREGGREGEECPIHLTLTT